MKDSRPDIPPTGVWSCDPSEIKEWTDEEKERLSQVLETVFPLNDHESI